MRSMTRNLLCLTIHHHLSFTRTQESSLQLASVQQELCFLSPAVSRTAPRSESVNILHWSSSTTVQVVQKQSNKSRPRTYLRGKETRKLEQPPNGVWEVKNSLNSCKKEFDQYMKGIVWHLGCKGKGLNCITQKNQSYLLMSIQFSIGMFKGRK